MTSQITTTHRSLFPLFTAMLMFLGAELACSEQHSPPASEPRNSQDGSKGVKKIGAANHFPEAFSQLPLWDDGLSEMSYYNAVDSIYGKPRQYLRVMLFNREWLSTSQRVKAEHPNIESDKGTDSPHNLDIPVFKLNIAEQIPTENYNYRYMVTVFLNRKTLHPEKLATSSQEWCGTTFKQYQWLPEGLTIRGFSYFEGEADHDWTLPATPIAYPLEALFILARAAVASNQNLQLNVLPTVRSTHVKPPVLQSLTMKISTDEKRVRVPFGSFPSKTVTAVWDSGEQQGQYTIENRPPYRLLSHSTRDGFEMSLRFVERRAYWDRSHPSRFYRQGAAP